MCVTGARHQAQQFCRAKPAQKRRSGSFGERFADGDGEFADGAGFEGKWPSPADVIVNVNPTYTATRARKR